MPRETARVCATPLTVRSADDSFLYRRLGWLVVFSIVQPWNQATRESPTNMTRIRPCSGQRPDGKTCLRTDTEEVLLQGRHPIYLCNSCLKAALGNGAFFIDEREDGRVVGSWRASPKQEQARRERLRLELLKPVLFGAA